MPWHGRNSVSVEGIQNMIQSLDQVAIPEELSETEELRSVIHDRVAIPEELSETDELRSVIHDCRLEDPQERPTADRLVLDYFSGKAIILLIYI